MVCFGDCKWERTGDCGFEKRGEISILYNKPVVQELVEFQLNIVKELSST
jgi:hypothetical protein